ncbi:MAG TPA: BON domain-containing protein [Pyrinomonadaceae bacterium]|jgi:hypothetical protein|nr:BON domain-containing protein [Pyrinomonadaceae bacterium]
MRKGILLGSGIGVGLGLMYVLDPAYGRRRRAMLRDRTTHFVHSSRVTLDKKARDFGNRARGLFAEARAALRRESVSDDVLVERVRSKLGRAVSTPGNVEVLAEEGHVTLRGVVRAAEAERLLRRVSRVRGVHDVAFQLNVKGRRGERELAASDVDGGANRNGVRTSLSARLLATAVGGGLALYGARRKGVVGAVAGVIGTRVLRRGVMVNAPRRIV